ncbi:N-acetyldiaminopimelate deacetylase [Alteribacillus persepolensis]|uniref:N-acetyldiaminopimelate deacetylase n=1 Tax=Alteribacillus persepolensis TaxID=568899 RepID=A0A1G7Y861_9BACI|nr:N-acetyldiaminopimelate deacetylase [Alteribacillus persepolensis]SDG92655.1 N-acetyldiaminopimelate deacetylase [Alteribacillus persepolensis]
MNEQQLINIRRDLHQIPELGFEEFKTQQYLKDTIADMPQDFLSIEEWETGLLVWVDGYEGEKTIGYRTDIDGLPIDEQTTYSFASRHEGSMHACGHDFHMTIALGILDHFAASQPKDNLLFIFQPAEEGPGGAKPMLAAEAFQRVKPDEIYALHIAPEYPVGTIATRPGLLFANTSELFIDFYGKGGHAARPHTANDMVVAASHFVTQLQTIVARNVNPLDSAVVTVGKITGGTKQNIIAGKARLEGTIRTLSMESMTQVKERIRHLTAGVETGFECKAEIDWGANYCQVYNDEELTRSFMEFSEQRDDIMLVECREAMTGEDFGYFLDEIPGVMFWLGVDTPYGLHDARIEPDERAIFTAVSHMVDYLSKNQ